MLKAKTGISTNQIAKEAGKEAVNMAYTEGIKLLFVYASCDYDLNELLSGIKETVPNTPIIGNTSFGSVITSDGIATGKNGFVGIMALSGEDIEVGVSIIEKEKENTKEDGIEVAKKAMLRGKSPDYLYMVASPGEEEIYMNGISEVIGRKPIFGGSAADNSIEGNWKLFTNEKIISDGVAVVFFYSNKKIKNNFLGAYRETNDYGVITKVENKRRLVEIDGVPALEKYAKWLNTDVENLRGANLLVKTITSPLGIKDFLGEYIAIRHPMFGNDDNSMNVGNNLSEKTCVIRMEATIDELIKSVREGIEELKKSSKDIAFFHLVTCGGRCAGIGERINEVVEALKITCGDIPYIMEFTFGEYGFVQDGRNTCGGLMISYTAFEA